MTVTVNSTPQEIFDFVVTKLWEQGGPSLGDIGCAYRGVNGRKCAAGWLIPDEAYTPELENKTSLNSLVVKAMGVSDPGRLTFIRDLQYAHDEVTDPNANGGAEMYAPDVLWARTRLRGLPVLDHLIDVGRFHNLNTDVVQKTFAQLRVSPTN